jgi:hypothetical protein
MKNLSQSQIALLQLMKKGYKLVVIGRYALLKDWPDEIRVNRATVKSLVKMGFLKEIIENEICSDFILIDNENEDQQ